MGRIDVRTRVKELVKYDDPILRARCEEFDPAKHGDPNDLALDLVETMLHHGGLGLSAPQIGVNARVLAFVGNPCTVMINPRIVDTSGEAMDLEEGCLTFPGLLLKISRPRVVKVRYEQPNGEVVTRTFSDMTARVIMHEVDHLDGVTIIEKQVGLRREMAKKKWAKLVKRGLERKIPGVVDMTELFDRIDRLGTR
jgi:peptide deformylase